MTATIEKTPAKKATKPRKKVETLESLVDTLGALNAQISALSAEAEAIKAKFKDSGQKEVIGTLFKVVVSTQNRSTLVADKVRKLLTPAEVAECTKTTESKTLTVYGL